MTAGGGAPAAAASTAGSALDVFRNRPFLLLWIAQAATQIGGNMVIFGLTVIIAKSTGSTTAVSALILTFLLPAVLFSALAGVFVDRLDDHGVLRARRGCDDPDARPAEAAPVGERDLHAHPERRLCARLHVDRAAHREDRRRPDPHRDRRPAVFRGGPVLRHAAGGAPGRPRRRSIRRDGS